MKTQRDQTNSSSFAFFNQIDDPNLLHQIQTYCGEYEKKEKQNQERVKKLSLLKLDEDYGFAPQSIFCRNLSRPSINFFQFSDCIESFQNFNEFHAKQKDKDRAQNETYQKISLQDKNINNRSFSKPGQSCNSDLKFENTQRQALQQEENKRKRLYQIIGELSVIKREVKDLLGFFQESVVKNN